MASRGTRGTFSTKQESFLEALLTCRTVLDAATQAQVCKRTADRWLADPAFKQRLAERQNTALAHVTRRLTGSMLEAIQTLESIHLAEGNPATARVSAARAILDSGLRYAELVSLSERVAELERRLIHEPESKS